MPTPVDGRYVNATAIQGNEFPLLDTFLEDDQTTPADFSAWDFKGEVRDSNNVLVASFDPGSFTHNSGTGEVFALILAADAEAFTEGAAYRFDVIAYVGTTRRKTLWYGELKGRGKVTVV